MTRVVTIVAIAVYLGTLIVAGIISRRKSQGFGDYITGGGSIPGWMLALSFFANYVSANSFVGHAAKSYETGLIWCVVGASMVVACAFSWHIIAPRFVEFARTSEASTLPDFYRLRFDSPACAQVVQWIVVAATLVYVLAVLRSTGVVLATSLEISNELALLVLYGVTLAYCVLGGIWADVSTDVIQAVFLVLGAIGLFVAVLIEPAGTPATKPLSPPPLLEVLAVALGGSVKFLVDPKQVLVFYAFKSPDDARRWKWIGPLLLLVVYACLLPVGFLARRFVPSVPDAEALVPGLVFQKNILGSWFGVAFMIALLAASMSSLDSALLVIAACLEKHAVAPLLGKEPSASRARWVLAGVATLALALAFRDEIEKDVVKLTTFAGTLLGAGLLPSVLVGLGKWRVPGKAVLASIVAGVLAAILGKFLPSRLGIASPWIQDVFVGILASTLVLLPFVRRPDESVREAHAATPG